MISILIVSVSSVSIYAQSQYDIPSWIKNTALWYGQEQISDTEFISALQFLVKEGILVIPFEENLNL